MTMGKRQERGVGRQSNRLRAKGSPEGRQHLSSRRSDGCKGRRARGPRRSSRVPSVNSGPRARRNGRDVRCVSRGEGGAGQKGRQGEESREGRGFISGPQAHRRSRGKTTTGINRNPVLRHYQQDCSGPHLPAIFLAAFTISSIDLQQSASPTTKSDS